MLPGIPSPLRALAGALALGLGAVCFSAPSRPARTFDLQHVKWKVQFEARTATVVGDVVNTIRPLKNGLTQVRLDAGPMEIQRVEANWQATTYKRVGESIIVRLRKPAQTKDLVHVRVVYRARPTAGVYFVPDVRAFPSTTGMIYTQGEMEDTRYWLPTYDYPDDKATSEGTLIVPTSWKTISNGKLLDAAEAGGQKTWRWKIDQPHATYLISFVAGRYAEIPEAWEGIPVVSYVPPNLLEEGKPDFLGTADMVAFFSRLTGFRYPFAKFAQTVVADFPFGGMENISAVTNTLDTVHPSSSEPWEDSEGLILHELAHQWFGDTVTCSDWPHVWINEGFASFLPSFFVREKHGQVQYDVSRHDTFEGAIETCFGNPREMVAKKYDLAIDVFDGHAYAGGAARLFMLMAKVGEAKFWKGIEDYLNEWKFKNTDTDIFFAAMQKSTGEDLQSFKKQWFYQVNNPRVKASLSGTKLVLEQPEAFAWDLETFFVDSGTLVKTPIREKRTEIDLPSGVSGPFLVDPYSKEMVRVEYPADWTADRWLSVWLRSPGISAKLRLIPILAGKLDAATQDRWIKDEALPELVSRMVGAAQQVSTGLLLELANHPDPFVRRAAIDRLGGRTADAGVVEKLTEVFEKDAAEPMRSSALNGLLNSKDAAAFAEKAWATPSFRMSFRTRALQHWTAKDPEKARAIAIAEVTTPTNEAIRRQAIDTLGSVKDLPGEDRVLGLLMKVARERSFGPKSAAINALGNYGSKAAIPVLEEAAKVSLHYVRRGAQAALAKLQK